MELYTLHHSTLHFTDFIPKLATALFQCALSNPGGLLPVNSEAGSPMTASVEPCKSASGIQVLTCRFFSCWIVSLASVLSLISCFLFVKRNFFRTGHEQVSPKLRLGLADFYVQLSHGVAAVRCRGGIQALRLRKPGDDAGNFVETLGSLWYKLI